jgi:hypothetical protein
MEKYGIVLKMHGEIWLGEFVEKYGEIVLEDGDSISDEKGIYDNLSENELSFCTFTKPQQDVVYIQDLQRVTISHTKFPSHTLKEFIAEGFLPEFAVDIYYDWMENHARSNGLQE